MDHQGFESFFMWGAIVGAAFMALNMIGWIFLRTTAHRIHGRLFGVVPGTVDIAAYAYLGLLKAGLVCLFLLPWIALVITRPPAA